VAYPCFYGVDFPSREELIYGRKYFAANGNQEAAIDLIAKEIGADSLAYLSIDGLIETIEKPREKMCLACYNGQYWASHAQTRKYLNNGRIE
jgi:amidophosphoribosyltransferase